MYSGADTSQKKTLAKYGAIKVLAEILNTKKGISEDDLIIILEGLEGFFSVYGKNIAYNPFAKQFEELGGLCYLRNQLATSLSDDAFYAIIFLYSRYWT